VGVGGLCDQLPGCLGVAAVHADGAPLAPVVDPNAPMCITRGCEVATCMHAARVMWALRGCCSAACMCMRMTFVHAAQLACSTGRGCSYTHACTQHNLCGGLGQLLCGQSTHDNRGRVCTYLLQARSQCSRCCGPCSRCPSACESEHPTRPACHRSLHSEAGLLHAEQRKIFELHPVESRCSHHM
jgi:hypothetical protein